MPDRIDERRAITPAAEWLVDNYYLVERRGFAEIHSALPPGYYRQLAESWSTARSLGIPRVFGVAWAFIAHTDSRFDTEMLCRFLCAYQDVQPLTIGELLGSRDHAADRADRKTFAGSLNRSGEAASHGRRRMTVADRLL